MSKKRVNQVNYIDEALQALLRLKKRLIGRASGASCSTDVEIVKISKELKTIKDTMTRLKQERDEARQEVCFLLSRTDLNVTPGCDGDTPEFHATARGWVYLFEKEEDDKI
jgi:hypothetical protein